MGLSGFGVEFGDSLLWYLAVPADGKGVVTRLHTGAGMWERRRKRGVRDNMFCFRFRFSLGGRKYVSGISRGGF